MPAKARSKKRLGEKAYQQINERIVTLKLRPGEQIDEVSLERDLSIGRTPIREALQRLAGEKLLDSVPGRGFFVRPISIDDIKELFEALTIFEREAVHLAANRIRKEQLKRLAEVCDRHKNALAKKNLLKLTMLNSEYHRLVYEATQNRFLQTALDGIQRQAERLAYLTYTSGFHPKNLDLFNEKAIRDHENLIESFASKDADRAVKIITAHCRRFFLRICYYLEPRVTPLETFLEDEFNVHNI